MPNNKNEKVGDLLAHFYQVRFFAPSLQKDIADFNRLRTDSGLTPLSRQQINNEIAARKLEFARVGRPKQLTPLVKKAFDVENSQNKPFGEDLQKYITDISIELIGGSVAKVTINLAPPFFDAIRIVDSRLIRRSSIVEVKWGYITDDGSINGKTLDFQITSPTITIGQDTSISIVGYDLLYSAALSRDFTRSWDRKKYPTDLDIIKTLASELGIPKVDTTGVVPGGLGATEFDFIINQVVEVKQKPEAEEQRQSDWVFLRKMVFNNNLSFYVENDTLFLVDRNTMLSKPCKYRFMWYEQLTNHNDIPMINYSSKALESIFNTPRALGNDKLTADPDKGVTTKKSFDPAASTKNDTIGGDETKSGVGSTIIGPIRKKNKVINRPAGTRTYAIIPRDKANGDEEARQISRNGEFLSNTMATVSSPGVPGLRPHDIVEVAGVGESFGGFYYVLKVNHKLGTNGYDMETTLIRNGTKVAEPGSSKAKGKTNGKRRNNCKPVGAEVEKVRNPGAAAQSPNRRRI